MIIILCLVLSIILLDIAAWLWGVDTTERFNSPEWERRREWGGCDR